MSDARLRESGMMDAFRWELAARRRELLLAEIVGADTAMHRWIQSHKGLIFFSGMIVVGLLMHVGLHFGSFSEHWKWLASTIAMLADALVVAALLGLTVDRFLKRDLIRDVGAIFIGWALPQEVKDHIREVSRTSIVRKNVRIHYKLTENDGGVDVQVTIEAEVYNFGASVEPYSPLLSLDLHDCPDESATMCDWTIDDKAQSWKPTCDGRSMSVSKDEHTVTWKAKPLRLRSQDATDSRVKPASTTRWTFLERMPIPYTDFFATSEPTIDVQITADCPPSIAFTCDGPTSHAEGSNRWLYERLYMPGQSIRVRWKRISERQPAASSPIQQS
jgi:hypothetical protein